MKTKINIVLCVLFLFFVGQSFAQQEQINTFKSTIEVQADGKLKVSETISVYANGNQIQRGIYRALPFEYKTKLGRKFRIDYTIEKVLKDGIVENFHTKKENGFLKIYIGNKDIFLSNGNYTYTIIYSTDRQIGFYEDFDEIYWNVNGVEWNFEIKTMQAEVILPPTATIKQYTAYTGYFGENGKDFEVKQIAENKILFKTTRSLNANENLSVAVAWQKGIVAEPTLIDKIKHFLYSNRMILVLILGSLISFLIHLFYWKKVGEDPPQGTIIPLFKPKNDLSPSAMRYIMEMKADMKGFTSALVSMATKGWIKIEKKNIYYLHKIDDEQKEKEKLTPSEKAIYNTIFAKKNKFKLSNTNYVAISNVVEQYKTAEAKIHKDTYFKLNRKYLVPGVMASLLTIGLASMVLSSGVSLFKGLIFVLVVLGITSSFTGKISKAFNASTGILVLFIAFSSFSHLFVSGGFQMIAFIVAIILLLILNFYFLYLMKAPTIFGRKEMDNIEGFKMYLKTAEEDRLNAQNIPNKTPQLFEKYLPYAIALNCENQWANKFKNIIAKAMQSGEYEQPTWYTGRGHFVPRTFVNDIGSKFNDAVNRASVPPPSERGSSSGGGWSGGSGGGGFSGGGGGGGGGGGW